MSKHQEFIDWVESLIRNQEEPIIPSDGAASYWEALKSTQTEKEKPDFTDNGKLILRKLQEMPQGAYKAKDIAEALFIMSKSVSGAMRKLVTDGFLAKLGENPFTYSFPKLGESVSLDEE